MARKRAHTSQLNLFERTDGENGEPALRHKPVASVVRNLARQLPSNLFLGTSSWSFPGWDGIVYEGDTSKKQLISDGLRAYAEHPLFRSVGLDRTYYGPISAADFGNYAEQVPENFRFLVKAHQLCTSPKQIDASATHSRVSQWNPHFLSPSYVADMVLGPMLEGLGDKAGVLLFQFPPIPSGAVGGAQRFAERLHGFLEKLPSGPIYAVELRTAELLTRNYAAALTDNGAVHCYNVHPTMPEISRQARVVAPAKIRAVVVRWMLGSGLSYERAKEAYAPFNALVDEDPTSRLEIARMCQAATDDDKPTFVIANNKAEGCSPLTLRKLAEQIALNH